MEGNNNGCKEPRWEAVLKDSGLGMAKECEVTNEFMHCLGGRINIFG